MKKSHYTLCYVSSVKSPLTNRDLNHLFRVNKRNNTLLEISGVLIYNDGNFLQILEGDKNKIDNLFTKISNDSRHKNIIEIINAPIQDKIFSDYKSSGFILADDYDLISNLDSYLNWIKEAELPIVDRVVNIIEKFLGKELV